MKLLTRFNFNINMDEPDENANNLMESMKKSVNHFKNLA